VRRECRNEGVYMQKGHVAKTDDMEAQVLVEFGTCMECELAAEGPRYCLFIIHRSISLKFSRRWLSLKDMIFVFRMTSLPVVSLK
jgi:hypothetical protein